MIPRNKSWGLVRDFNTILKQYLKSSHHYVTYFSFLLGKLFFAIFLNKPNAKSWCMIVHMKFLNLKYLYWGDLFLSGRIESWQGH